VRITANATGFCNSTGTTNAVSVRLQRWTSYGQKTRTWLDSSVYDAAMA
jgi:hypothetical protein